MMAKTALSNIQTMFLMMGKRLDQFFDATQKQLRNSTSVQIRSCPGMDCKPLVGNYRGQRSDVCHILHDGLQPCALICISGYL